jgi:hypothetical protein
MKKYQEKMMIGAVAIFGTLLYMLSFVHIAHAQTASTTEPAETICCSNILFLPGLEGTYLYKPDTLLFGFGNTTNTLWPPNTNNDVKHLYLNDSGQSTDDTIYSGEPIGKAFGLVDIYGKFVNFLNEMVKNGDINEWISYGYDWRRAVPEVASWGENRATTTEYLINRLIDLAGSSKTGKVTIIAHSNGGLVAKFLIKVLTARNQAYLVDSLISVAVPYLGTPQAIASLLHGDGQELGLGLLLNKANARQLGKNMASAYTLLPSRQYFSKILNPTIAFASTTALEMNSGHEAISSFDDQVAFIDDSSNLRASTTVSDIKTPIQGNSALMDFAESLHYVIDTFTWPLPISRWAIVGWNNRNTISGILYNALNNHTNVTTTMGDDTVIAPSAAYDAGKITSADLSELTKQEKKDIKHMNILEASSTQVVIKDMLHHNPANGNFDLPSGMAWGEPDYSKPEQTSLIVSTHSPVELHVYDEQGRHTGLAPIPKEMQADDGESFEEGFLTYYENNIPGSSFDLKGDDPKDRETYIYLPDDGQKYTVVIKGLDIGKFDYWVERYRGNLNGQSTTLGEVKYYDVPVTARTLATSTIQFSPASLYATSTPDFGSTTILRVDVDGDGKQDMQFQKASAIKDPAILLTTIRKMIVSFMGVSRPQEKGVLNFLDAWGKNIDRKKEDKLIGLLTSMEKFIQNKPISSLSEDEKTQALSLLEKFVIQNK